MTRILLFLLGVISLPCISQTVKVNAAFGENGYVQIPNAVNGLDLRLESAAFQADGRLVAVGSQNKTATGEDLSDFFVVRLNSDGSYDKSFGANGKAVTDFEGNSDVAFCVAVQQNGKTVVAGRSRNQDFRNDLAIARYNSNGTLDASFGIGGKVIAKLEQESGATTIAIQDDGKIVVGGLVYSNVCDFLLLRYKTDGTLDKTFGSNGKVVQDFNAGFDLIANIAIQKDGKILASGDANTDFPLVRYNTDGSLDKTFGKEGKMVVDQNSPAYAPYYIRGLSVQPDGKIVVGGQFGGYGGNGFGVARVIKNGTIDESFGSGGVAETFFGFYTEGVNSIALQKNGRIVLGGMVQKTAYPPNDYNVTNDDWDFAMVRYNHDGTLDKSFGKGGLLLANFGGSSAYASGDFLSTLLLQNDRLFAVGMSVLYEHEWGDPVNGAIAAYTLEKDYQSPINIAVPSSGLKPYTVYIGYAPAAVLALQANASYSSESTVEPAFAYSWSAGPGLIILPGTSNKGEVQISATGTGNYQSTVKVEVIDAVGCSSAKEFIIKVVDARCGEKVLVCKGNKAVRKTICVAPQAVAALLAHGGSLGSCEPSIRNRGTSTLAVQESTEMSATPLVLSVLPNPSHSFFTLRINAGSNEENLSWRVWDASGRLIESRGSIVKGSQLQFGSNYPPGVYFVEVVQGVVRQQMKLIKVRN